MSKLQQWVALGVVAVLAVLSAGWFLLVGPTRSEAAALREQAVQQDLTNARVRTQLQVLQAQADALPEQRARLAVATERIPDAPRLPALVRALGAAAEESDVELVSIVPGLPEPVTATSTGTPTTTPTGTTAEAAPEATRPVPAGGVGTLHALPVTLNVVGGYFQIERYLDALEDLPRAWRVSGLTVAPGADPVAAVTDAASAGDGRSLAAVITGSVYLAAGASSLPATGVPFVPGPATAAQDPTSTAPAPTGG